MYTLLQSDCCGLCPEGEFGSYIPVLVFSLRLIHAILAQSRAGLEARINTDEPVIRDLPQTHSKE